MLIPAPFQSIDGYKGIDDVFDPEMNRKSLEVALEKASREGLKARAVLLSKYEKTSGLNAFCNLYTDQLSTSVLTIQSVDAT